MRPGILLSTTDHRIATRHGPARLFPARFARDGPGGAPIREFVALARLLMRAGWTVHETTQPPYLDDVSCAGRCPVYIVKFGPADPVRDAELIRRYSERNSSEWNIRNLEMIDFWDGFIETGRRTWTVNLHTEADRLAELLAEHGRLFVKSLVKSHAAVVESFDLFMRRLGPVSRLDARSAELLVSEVIELSEIDAVISKRQVRRTDEWRHWIFKGECLASTHAFSCDARRTSNAGRTINERLARDVSAGLSGTDFATSYVLDTGTLRGGEPTVIEANPFFASGIYDPTTPPAIARALIEDARAG